MAGQFEFLPSHDFVILSLRTIWRAAAMDPHGN
jgi:hypothetical protein